VIITPGRPPRFCDARLLDGSLVNMIAPPLVIDGAVLAIRQFKKDKFILDELIRSARTRRKTRRPIASTDERRLHRVEVAGHALRFQWSGERSRDRVELRGEFRADERDCGDDHDRNQAGDEAVLDGGNAGFIVRETKEEVFHGSDPGPSH
jgi:hypothetical protein